MLVLLANAASAAVIQPELKHSLRSPLGVNNIIVTMKEGVDRAIEAASRKISVSRADKITNLADTLIDNAKTSQTEVMELLSVNKRNNNAFVFESFWASNTVFIENASNDLVLQLANLDSVEEIHKEHFVTLDPITEDDEVATTEEGLQWGIDMVKADKVWADGNTGEGIIVSTIDTGVRLSHEILSSNYIGAELNGWLDPYQNTETPNDGNGHGTHTMGTIAGVNGYGVAPGVKWMACKGCSTSGCTEKALLKCGEYTLCPTDTNGKNKNCSLAPHISSNSWGGGAGENWYRSTVNSWRAAGIIPVFAMGNSGPSCGSANSPGDYDNVIAVGATTVKNTLASFSSVGPTANNLMKPEVSAPGQQVKSAWFDADTGYKTISGTSMACPHVAGAIALMLAAKPTLEYQEIYNALTMSCSVALTSPNKNCGAMSDKIYPNNMFGWGVLHTVDAIDSIGKTPPTPPTQPPMECVTDFMKRCMKKDECSGSWFGYCKASCAC